MQIFKTSNFTKGFQENRNTEDSRKFNNNIYYHDILIMDELQLKTNYSETCILTIVQALSYQQAPYQALNPFAK